MISMLLNNFTLIEIQYLGMCVNQHLKLTPFGVYPIIFQDMLNKEPIPPVHFFAFLGNLILVAQERA